MPINLAVFDLSSYLPDSLVPQYEALRDAVVSFLETIGIAKGIESASAGEFPIQVIVCAKNSSQSTDTSKARNAFQKAENSLNIAKKEKEQADKDLARLFDPEWYGKEGEWKKLDGLCLEKDTGE